MLPIGIALIILGLALGFFFPVMFVAAVVGAILLIVFFVGSTRAASRTAAREEPAPNRDE